MSIAFGPVPSRRLGRSLGINNIPAKTCTYSCVYCQVGSTLNMQVTRKTFYDTAAIFEKVERKVRETRDASEPVDFLTFVSDGEPTLDINLGKTIEALKPLGVKIGVISNASLISQAPVRDALESISVNTPYGKVSFRQFDGFVNQYDPLNYLVQWSGTGFEVVWPERYRTASPVLPKSD